MTMALSAPPPEDATWGRRLREAREGAGLTQVDLAGTVGRSQAAVAAWEADRQIPSDRIKLAIAKALRRRVHDLFPFPDNGEAA